MLPSIPKWPTRTQSWLAASIPRLRAVLDALSPEPPLLAAVRWGGGSIRT